MTALKRADPLVIAAAGRELIFRVKTRKLKAAEAEEVAQKLRLLGWEYADPIPMSVGKTVSSVRAPWLVVKRYAYVRARCRLCHETVDLTPGPLALENEVRKLAQHLSNRMASPVFHEQAGGDCLGLLDVLGVVFRKP